MRTVDDLIEVLESICKRRYMYVCGGSFYEVCAYIQGYAASIEPYPLRPTSDASFGIFVAASLGYPHKLAWPYVLKTASRDDEQAIEKLHDLLGKYLEAVTEDKTPKLIAEAQQELAALNKNPPSQVACWRQFSHALNHGDEQTLKKLILPHDSASVLWESSYPTDVAPLMDQIEQSYAIPVVSQSDDGLHSQIMSPDYGIVNLEQLNGEWRINAEPIISVRLNASREADA